ncbi:unnamed protein product [Phyllotreta striolata]|uniref:Band 4.1 domain-containing protein n=1 Tax=Phyllotreta striolata TaxID=444603 RepID=A0A9N9TIN4_PHYSR|nr:unnamed protein product [Phyllotreta striolata]
MKTVVSKTGIEVLYPCTIHLLKKAAIVECEYKSDSVGQDLLDYICDYFHFTDAEYWGLKFIDSYGQRHWLEADRLIRVQVKNCCPVHFQLRINVFPPEPYKLADKFTKDQIFMQLRLSLLNGSLGCGSNDAPLFISLLLQYNYGDHDEKVHFGNYVKDKIILNQTFASEVKAIEIHRTHLKGLTGEQAQDLLLRLSCQSETYGVDPYVVENENGEKVVLYINCNGLATYKDAEKVEAFDWMSIGGISQDKRTLLVHSTKDEVVRYVCVTEGECNYIRYSAVNHLKCFTGSGYQSTMAVVGVNDDNVSDKFIKQEICRLNNDKKIKRNKFCKFFTAFICWYTVLFAVFFMICFFVHLFDLISYDLSEITRKITLLGWLGKNT